MMRLALQSLVLGIAFTAAALPAKTVDRRPLFTQALNQLAYHIYTYATETEANDGTALTTQEQAMMRELYQIATKQSRAQYWRDQNQWSQNPEMDFRLSFRDEQGYFRLDDPGQPVRTAVTTNDPRGDVLVNTKLINDPANLISYLDAVQLLVHEIGHKIGQGKNQEAIDAFAAKLRKHLESHVRKIDLRPGVSLTFVSGALVDSDRLLPEFAGRGVAAFVETEKAVTDVSAEFAQYFRSQTRLSVVGNWAQDGMGRMTALSIRDVQVLDDAPGGKLRVRAMIDRQETLIDKGSGSSFLASQHTNGYRKTKDYHELDLTVRKDNGLPAGVVFRRRYPVNTDAQIKDLVLRDLPESRVEVTGRLDGLQAKSLRLMLEIGSDHIEIEGKLVEGSTDRYRFEWKWPDAIEQKSVRVRSFVVNQEQIVYAAEGREIDLSSRAREIDRMKLESVRVKTPFGYTRLNDKARVAPGEFTIRLVFNSKEPLKEIRLGWGRTYQLYDPSRYANNPPMNWDDRVAAPRYMHGDNPEAYRSDYEVVHYTADEFTQTRDGDRIIVDLPLKDELKSLRSYTRPTYTYHMGGAFGMNMNMTRETIVGDDIGERYITHLSATNESLQRLGIQTKFRYKIDRDAQLTEKQVREKEQKRFQDYWNSFDHGLLNDAGAAPKVKAKGSRKKSAEKTPWVFGTEPEPAPVSCGKVFGGG